MKKIAISAVLTPTDDSITAEGILDILRKLGLCYTVFEGEVETVPEESLDLPREVWLYVPFDDEEPYLKVSASGSVEGEELSYVELEALRNQGVCMAFHADFPRASRYGVPHYAINEDYAACVAGFHGFKTPHEGLELSAKDRGDDGGEDIWLKIALPAAQ